MNGSQGIAVGMATSIPPHNLVEVCDALVRLIDEPGVSIDELMEIVPGPDFPTGGIVCGRGGLRRGYHTGRGTIVLRARTTIEEHGKGRYRIVVNEVPYQAARDRVEERIAALVNDGRIPGISGCRNESDLQEPVRLVLELKRDADPDVVLNQLYQFSPLQDTVSLIFLALVDGKPRVLSFKELLQEFLRHREIVIRRRTQFLLAKARQRKHTVEGLLLALAAIEEVIRVIRSSASQEEAKRRLTEIKSPAALLHRALGDEGFELFQAERGRQESYSLTPVQADAILRMTLGQLVNLEQEKLGGEHRDLIEKIRQYNRILSDRQHLLAIIRQDLLRAEAEISRAPPHGNHRRGDRRHRPRRPDRRGDDGRLDQRQRLRQADARLGLPGPASGRQGPDRRQDRRGRSRSSTSSWPAPIPICCSSPTGARPTGGRCTTCRSRGGIAAAAPWSTCSACKRASGSPIAGRCATSISPAATW